RTGSRVPAGGTDTGVFSLQRLYRRDPWSGSRIFFQCLAVWKACICEEGQFGEFFMVGSVARSAIIGRQLQCSLAGIRKGAGNRGNRTGRRGFQLLSIMDK